jgi:hypothetical protein
MLFPDNPALSALVLALIAIPFLYAARHPMHGLIQSLTRAAGDGLRLGGRWFERGARELRARNKTVLLARGREEVRQEIEREFDRLTAQVQRDLGGYPALQRRLLDELTRVEEDYQKCGEVPPPPPEWIKAVETIAAIKNTGDGLVQKILEDISKSIAGIYDKVVAEYRRSYEERHNILKGFMPFWRSLEQTLTRVDRNLAGMQEGASKIDALMDKYREINAGSVKVEHALTSSAGVQFAIAAIVLAVAFGGAFVNFWLIQRPMSTMVGAGEYIAGGIEASYFAAFVIILVESAMGLFLMEALRITHLFPRINALPDKMRQRLVWIFFGFLLVLAGVEVALAVMRDMIVHADLLTRQRLSGLETAPLPDAGWVQNIPVAGQMILGFILPFALAFVAIPLEYFISSARTVLGALLVLALHALGLALRVAAGIVRHLGRALVMLYDAAIFIPVLIEKAVSRGRNGAAAFGRTSGGEGA